MSKCQNTYLRQFSHVAEYFIKTEVNDSCIHQEVSAINEITGIREKITSIVTDTREKQFQEALIKLGWTPPKE